MAAIVLVAAAGVFVLGAVAGIVAVVSYGIHREQERLRGDQGTRAGPDAPDYFLPEQAPDVVSGAARRLNGLYVHHLPSRSLAAAVTTVAALAGVAAAPALANYPPPSLHLLCTEAANNGTLESSPPPPVCVLPSGQTTAPNYSATIAVRKTGAAATITFAVTAA